MLEQMTYLLFMKMLDDVQVQQESLSRQLGIEMAADDATFAYGTWHNPETVEDVPVEELRWHTFKHYDADRMYRTISTTSISAIPCSTAPSPSHEPLSDCV